MWQERCYVTSKAQSWTWYSFHLFPFLGHLPLKLSCHAVRKHRLTHMERSMWSANTAPSRQSPPNTRHQWRSFQTVSAPSLWVFHRQLQTSEQRPAGLIVPPSKFLTHSISEHDSVLFCATEFGGNLLCICSNWNRFWYHVNNTKEK